MPVVDYIDRRREVSSGDKTGHTTDVKVVDLEGGADTGRAETAHAGIGRVGVAHDGTGRRESGCVAAIVVVGHWKGEVETN